MERSEGEKYPGLWQRLAMVPVLKVLSKAHLTKTQKLAENFLYGKT